MHRKNMVLNKTTIVQIYENLGKAKTEIIKWISAMKKDLDAAGIKQADV